MSESEKQLLYVCLLFPVTALVFMTPDVLFREDTFYHFVLSAIIAPIYFGILKDTKARSGIVLHAIVFCVTVGILKEIFYDSVIGLNDVVADFTGAILGIYLVK